jgi:hypothetical protein
MLLSAGAILAQSTVLTGKVTDDKGEALIGASVKVLKSTDFVRGAITDYNGDYRIQVDPGTFDVEVAYTGFATSRQTGVVILGSKINTVDVQMSTNTTLQTVVIQSYKAPLIEQDKTGGGQTLTSETIKNLPTRSVNAIVATTAGATSIDGGDVNIKGSRSNATNYYIDGIRVSGSQPPVQDIEQLSVLTSGLGAEYGDVTGGVIAITTKGPASSYHGEVNVENSNGLDPYGYLLATANVSGPIVKKKLANGNTRTVVGFRLSGTYNKQKDDQPSAVPLFRAKDSVLKNLDAHPLTKLGSSVVSGAERLTQDSVDALKYHPNNGVQSVDLTGKLDFRLSDKVDLSFTGTFRDVQNQFTPGGWGSSYWLLLNSQNNPTDYARRFRTIARFRHRLGGNDDEATTAASANKIAISNASYTLQFGFERGTDKQYDPRHGDRLFDYGYIGRFNYQNIPVFGDTTDTQGIRHRFQQGYQDFFTNYQPGYINSAGKLVIPNGGKDANGGDNAKGGLAAYNEFATPGVFQSYIASNGRFNSTYTSIWGGMHENINQVYNQNSKAQDDVLTISASSSFDLRLGRTGVHNIQFGLLNEQRTNRSYVIAPYGLWNLADLQINGHFNGLNYDKQVGKVWDPQVQDSLPIFAYKTINLDESTFYRKARSGQSTPIGIDQYVNIQSFTPDQLKLSMFAARELTDQGLVNYYGYDYLGNRTPDGVTFNDFFTTRDQEGVRTFPVAALKPLYQAAYIKDKFTFNKMIFSLGLRVERYDLNTKVLRDPYSLYQIMNAKDYYATVPGPPARPGTIRDNFKVYVNSLSSPTPKAFRDGDTWYFGDGRQANDGNVIFGGGVVTPLLADTISGDDILDKRYNPNTSFEDYKPQINWLPRLAFSFPISKDANFFAHYDVLVQRPPDNWQVTPLNYLYFYTAGRTPQNNASLKPERVVDYEVGFQQKLNQNSALKFSAYYREMRDMIQARTILYVPVIGSYETYGNLDFGTVKGFTVAYDLRRIQNFEMRLAYTLQFADGTGSDANSQRGLTTRGNIRSLFPLNFDERHNIQAILDYRFDRGETYNGPRIGGHDILADFGINMQISGVSGRPYTAKSVPARFGGSGTVGTINGNRLPWRMNVDLRIDKSFNLSAKGKNPLSLNVYLRVSNLLNRQNVIGVYPVTGSPKNDGFLASQEGQQVQKNIQSSGQSLAAYQASYSWVSQNPGYYTLPRRIYIGAVFGF